MVLTTGNKSEMAVGYATLYGDMCGGYNVLKDVYKTDVYRDRPPGATPTGRFGGLSRSSDPRPHPHQAAQRPSCAPDQTDQDSLPPYDDARRHPARPGRGGGDAG